MDLSDSVRTLLIDTAHSLRGAERRRFLAQAVDRLGLGQREAHRQLGWDRSTLRKALHELRSGITCCDACSARGRKPAEFHLPRLLDDIRDLVRDQCQADPTFRTTRLYCRLSAAEVRRQLVQRKGYREDQLPTIQTITTKLNRLGFRLRKVAKCRPQKKYRKPMPSSSS
jgi:hypothetical protein